jgi:hypothetical protein
MPILPQVDHDFEIIIYSLQASEKWDEFELGSFVLASGLRPDISL